MSRSARIASALALSPANSLAGKPAPHAFPNGDAYTGAWAKGLPEGEGVYTWADGSTYEGAWQARRPRAAPARPARVPPRPPALANAPRVRPGRQEARPGHVHVAERRDVQRRVAGGLHARRRHVRGPRRHGVPGAAPRPCWPGPRARRPRPGLSRAPVQGGWAADLKQGLGRKVYANGDVYSGLWVAGKCEGPGRYRWRNVNEYNGEWRAGCMHGQGTLRWHTGARPAARRPPAANCGCPIAHWAARARAARARAERGGPFRAPLPVDAEWRAPTDARGRMHRCAGR